MNLAGLLDDIADDLSAAREMDLDALDEVALAERVFCGLSARGRRAEREVRYPYARGARSRGQRCDLVVDETWIEIKRASRVGPGGEDPTYQWRLFRGACEDVTKLARDRSIERAAFVAFVFDTEDAGRVVARNLGVALVDHGLPVGLANVRAFPIRDWRGNAACTVFGVEVRS